ncbi:TIGR03084 family protein [Actinophytocola xinjiangensis]|uniref:TIGR03084 family protein n=1 Tax=Actinophytocola xinjiangensis TaxID=485602 RepID=A0A7Z1B023_9PSEU|nr:TIGR03084 family metal-binding protein [Actinophytocola xinjiangensis]OLF12861.1 TIGR03084 family protein [Actinophytocola xinjiangensis]
MVELTTLVADLRAEGTELDGLVRDLPAAGWARPTPAPGWTVAHQIAHLAWTDQRSLLAITDPDAFHAEFAEIAATTPLDQLDKVVDQGADEGATLPPADLLAHWRQGREDLATAIEGVPAGSKLPWYGPPMSPASMATARLMETWAHGNDVADALDHTRTPTGRLRHVAHIAVRTRDWAYLVRQEPPPGEPFLVELTGPAGDTWTWGPADAAQRVTGPALDFCLLATQRVHRADTALIATGADADRWLDIAQAFAGPPGQGRTPR